MQGVAHLMPGEALRVLENALRDLLSVTGATGRASRVQGETLDKKSGQWADRAEVEQRRRGTRGALVTPAAGLAYSNLYDLVRRVDQEWEAVRPALHHKKETMALLEWFESHRDSVGHSRQLLPFEEDLLSGIAGLIRNQVTIYMSSHDPAGDIYPRIDSLHDSFGRSVTGLGSGHLSGILMGSPKVILHPGEPVVVRVSGVDPQGRDLDWKLTVRGVQVDRATTASGVEATMSWTPGTEHVSERTLVELWMSASGASYHRHGHVDHTASLVYVIRPPL